MLIIFKTLQKSYEKFHKNPLLLKPLLYIQILRVLYYGTDARINPKRS